MISVRADVLVVGAGLAAMKSAVTAAHSGLSVVMAVKAHLCSGASFYPMMDMLACQTSTGVPEEDEQYLKEILEASQGMADEGMNRVYIDTIRQRVAEFPEIGITDYQLTGPKVACFAKTARPTYSWSNWPRIRRNMRSILTNTPNITLLEHTTVISILITDGAVSGAVLIGKETRETLGCKSIILATGGMGDLYEHNLSTPDVSGDGQALSLMAGAELINIEFIQLIPGFISPAYKTVFREGTLPYLDSMKTADGRDLLATYSPDREAREECLRLRGTHGPFTANTVAKYFDIAMMEEMLKSEGPITGFAIRYRPEISLSDSDFVGPYVRWLNEKHGVDLAKEEIRIAPFYHAANGGVKIDSRCRTNIPGLFACGEVSGGIHGADRLGGHSTGSCLVFGYLAGIYAAQYAMGTYDKKPQDAAEALHRDYAGKGSLEPETLLPSIRRTVFRTGNVIRQEKALQAGIAQLKQWQSDYNALSFLNDPRRAANAVKAAHFLLLGRALLSAMDTRKESRGSHYRKDYPQKCDAFGHRLVVRISRGDCVVSQE